MAVGLGAASLAVSVYGAVQQHGAAQDAAAAEGAANAARQRLLERQAIDVKKKGRETADLIYRKAFQTRSLQVAQQAASGVVVGDGSAAAAVNETTYLARADAIAEIQESREQAEQIRAGAAYDAAASAGRQSAYRDQATAALINGASSALSIAGNYYQNSGNSSAIKVEG